MLNSLFFGYTKTFALLTKVGTVMHALSTPVFGHMVCQRHSSICMHDVNFRYAYMAFLSCDMHHVIAWA